MRSLTLREQDEATVTSRKNPSNMWGAFGSVGKAYKTLIPDFLNIQIISHIAIPAMKRYLTHWPKVFGSVRFAIPTYTSTYPASDLNVQELRAHRGEES